MRAKVFSLLVAFCIAGVFLNSCENDEYDYGLDKYYVEIGTAVEKNVFLLDNGKTILNVGEKAIQSFQRGERIYLNYTLLPETSTGYDYTVRVNAASKITLGKLKKTDLKEIESSVQEPVRLESIWVGSHYLNMQFYMNRKSESHTVGLLADSVSFAGDAVQIYFKHDPNNDLPGYPVHIFLSFDLEDVLGNPENNKTLAININTSEYGNKIYELNY
jgi:hypothetical protein